MKRFSVRDYNLFLFAILSIIVLTLIFPRLYPESRVNLKFGREQIAAKADSLIKYLGYKLPKDRTVIFMNEDDDQFRYLQNAYGIDKANNIVASDSVAMLWWVYNRVSPNNKDGGQTSHDNTIQVTAQNADTSGVYQVTLHLDLQGRPLTLTTKGAECFWTGGENKRGTASLEYADRIARKILAEDFPLWKFDGREDVRRKSDVESKFKWTRTKSVAGEDVVFTLVMLRDRVTEFNKHYSYPEGYSPKHNSMINFNIFYLILGVISVILFIKRLRSDFIDLKIGIAPAVIVVVIWGIGFLTSFYIQLIPVISILAVMGYLITSIFLAGSMWILFSLGESLSREIWPDKLVVMDSIRRRFFSSELSRAIVRGISIGFIISGFIALYEYVLVNYNLAVLSFLPNISLFYSHKIPWLYGMYGTLGSMFFITTVCFVSLPIAKKYLRWPVLGYVIVALMSMMVSLPAPKVYPEWANLLMRISIVLLFMFFMLKFEIVTLIIAGVSFPVIFYGYAGVLNTNPHIQVNGIILLSILAGLLIIALITKNRTVRPWELKEFVPDYLQRIYERERQHRELEIARSVQLSFLPQKCPDYKNAEIASFCIPAMETGGDYFDFIPLAPDKLGVAIGDVSGKGISASFYMTLTKGFLLSQARLNMSPRDVLININELFYENVKRGVFISMIYAIFDFSNSTLTLARAGHNPMIFLKSKDDSIEELESPGIGLGLEKGVVFNKTIENVIIPITRGDIFFFYTDGLNEAVNISGEEFGDERIKMIIRSNELCSAEELLEQIRKEINLFTKSMEQHDDMTAVAVKIV